MLHRGSSYRIELTGIILDAMLQSIARFSEGLKLRLSKTQFEARDAPEHRPDSQRVERVHSC